MPQVIRIPNFVPANGGQVDQVAHGFTVGQQLYYSNAGAWELAQADDSTTLKTGMVADVISPDVFVICYYGLMEWPSHGLTIGALYYLDDAVAGNYVEVKPTLKTSFVQGAFQVEDVRTVKVIDMAAVALGSSTAILSEIVTGYDQNVSGVTAGDWMQICVIDAFTSGDLYFSTNQSGNAPSMKLTVQHIYSLSKCYLSVQSASNGGLPWDEVVIAGGNNNGGRAEVWVHWNQVSAPAFDVSLAYTGSSSGNAGTPVVTWGEPLLMAGSPGTIRKSVVLDKAERTIFPNLVIPPSVSPFTTGSLVIDSGGLGTSDPTKGYGLVRFDGMPSPGSGSMIITVTADDTGVSSEPGAFSYGFQAVFAAYHNQSVAGASMRLLGAQGVSSGATTRDWMFDRIATSWDSGAMSFYIVPWPVQPDRAGGFRLNFNVQCSMNAVVITHMVKDQSQIGNYGAMDLKRNLGPSVFDVSTNDGSGSGPVL